MNYKFTILIQGRFDFECFNFFVRNYPNVPIVFSGWENDIENFDKLKKFYQNVPDRYIPDMSNIKCIFSPLPDYFGPVNFNLQCVSVLSGLNLIDTELVIKVRGDEYFSNLNENIIKERKIYCSPIFFRSMKYWTIQDKYHVSDHLNAGYKEDIYNFYINAQNKMYQDSFYHGERGLTVSYLESKGFHDFENLEEGRKVMIENFDIINIDLLKPYKIVSNGINRVWYSNYTVKYTTGENAALYNCIDKMEDL